MSDAIGEPLRSALAGRYDFLGECGRGGTSIVYRALDVRRQRAVAIKVMRTELASRATAERFLREARIAGAIDHPHVARLLDSGEVEGELFCVLEFIDGETLRARLTRAGQLPIEDALRITKDVASALSHAHRLGFIHRDVKPENILLSGDRAILSDFGIARAIVVAAGDRLTDSGIAVGTATYMSPEQAVGSSQLDERSDEYSLAVCLYEMLAGDPPFAGRSSQAVLARQMVEPPPRLEIARPSVTPGMIGAIEKALAKTPADRFASVTDFISALESNSTKPRRAHSKPSWIVGVGATLALAVVAGAIWSGMDRHPLLDPTRVMVFPGRTGASDTDPEEGLRIADAIQVAVEHTEPLRWIPAWDDLDSLTRNNPSLLQRTDARRLALRRGAGYFVTASTTTSGSGVSITLLLHDTAGDTVVAQESATDTIASGGTSSTMSLAIRALPRLLSHMLAPGRSVDLSPLTDRTLAATARLLEGEAAYRSSRFSTAFDRYREAVAEDSLFAYAAIKGAQAASWQNRLEDAIDLIRVARARANLLPPKYRPFLDGVEAYLDGRANDAVAAFRRALQIDVRWAEAAMALGDVYYHLIPEGAPLDSLAEASFAAAVGIDSSFTAPLFHLAEIAVRKGDVPSARAHLRRLTGDGADPSWTRHLMLMLRCVEGGMNGADWQQLANASPDDALIAARSLSAAGQQLTCAADGFRAVLESQSAGVGTKWGAALGRHGVLMAQGRPTDAVTFLDSVRTAIAARAWSYAALFAHADPLFAPMAREGATFAKSQAGQHYERASPRLGWVFGSFEALDGNRSLVDSVERRLNQLVTESPSAVSTLAAAAFRARAMIVRGDTDGAINQLLALPFAATRDSLVWTYFEPMASERLTLARLLFARGRYREALLQASVFDHQQPVVFLTFLRPSLELRLHSAERLGLFALANRFRTRLQSLAPGRPGSR